MVLYLDLLKALQNMSHGELNRPAIVATKQGLMVVKSLCKAEDYGGDTGGLPRNHLIVDVVHDENERTINNYE